MGGLGAIELLALYLVIVRVGASPGDSSPPYQDCTSTCRSQHSCPSAFSDPDWTRGDCFWCKYDCMWKTVDVFTHHGYSIPQFHGKWPFYSTFWAQEPASTVFSLLNLLSVNELRRRVTRLGEGREDQSEDLSGYSVMRRVWIGYTAVGVVTWLCSIWFHCSDHFWSERADYFTAFAFVLYANYAAILFVFPAARRGWKAVGIATSFLLFYLRHIDNMTRHFDYGWNMTLCVGCSVVTLLTYLYYLIKRWRLFGSLASLRGSDRLLLLVLAWTTAAISMELHDFVPIYFTVDAHALFHAATVPLPLFTARFIEAHARESGFEYTKIV